MSVSQEKFPGRKSIPKHYKPYGKSKGELDILFYYSKSTLNSAQIAKIYFYGHPS